jgi:hypothetical protein
MPYTGGPWLPEEIRIHLPDTTAATATGAAAASTAAASTAAASAATKGLSVSERADRPLDRGGNRGESLWYTAGAGAGEHKPPGGVRYKVRMLSHLCLRCKSLASRC